MGFCRLPDGALCFREMISYVDEEQLVPCHHVYFAGCNLRCEFCTVAEWNESPQQAQPLDVDALAATVRRRRAEGARTLAFLGGEPSVSILGALRLLARVQADVRVVWNSNMYYSPVVAELLDGIADIYLADLKCGNQRCAQAILGAADYVETAMQNVLEGSAGADVIIRHLVLPGHRECCLGPILEWIAEHLPAAKVSLRGDYAPPVPAGSAPAQYLSQDELSDAQTFATALGLHLV